MTQHSSSRHFLSTRHAGNIQTGIRVTDIGFSRSRIRETHIEEGPAVIGECFHRVAVVVFKFISGEGCVHFVPVDHEGAERDKVEVWTVNPGGSIQIPNQYAYVLHLSKGTHFMSFFTTQLPPSDVVHFNFPKGACG